MWHLFTGIFVFRSFALGCVVRQRLFKLRVRTQRLPEFDMPWMSSFQ